MNNPSLLTRIVSLCILLVVAIIASALLKIALHVVLWFLGVVIVLAIVLFVASKLRRAGRL